MLMSRFINTAGCWCGRELDLNDDLAAGGAGSVDLAWYGSRNTSFRRRS
jgi:hypothetical protein